MTLITLSPDAQAAFIALNKAVETKGADYIYPAEQKEPDTGVCRYNTYDEQGRITGPSCIVGFVCHETGIVSPEVLAESEGSIAWTVLPWPEDDLITRALTRAQAEQDEGHTWGMARDEAADFLRGEGVDLSFLD
jgi:hypothetical protein